MAIMTPVGNFGTGTVAQIIHELTRTRGGVSQHALLGEITFDLITYFEGMEANFSANYAEHALIEGKPAELPVKKAVCRQRLLGGDSTFVRGGAQLLWRHNRQCVGFFRRRNRCFFCDHVISVWKMSGRWRGIRVIGSLHVSDLVLRLNELWHCDGIILLTKGLARVLRHETHSVMFARLVATRLGDVYRATWDFERRALRDAR